MKNPWTWVAAIAVTMAVFLALQFVEGSLRGWDTPLPLWLNLVFGALILTIVAELGIFAHLIRREMRQ